MLKKRETRREPRVWSGQSPEHGHDRVIFMFAAMVGGLALSRAIRDVDDSGSADILRAVKKQLGHMVNG
jgi:hypothetical protein